MRPLKPDGRIDLDHRAYFLRGSPESSSFIAASSEGNVSLIDLPSNSITVFRPSKQLRAISPHPVEQCFAWVDGESGALFIQDFSGTTVTQVDPPWLAADNSGLENSGFDDCFFSDGGKFLWLAAHLNDDECEISLIETKSWTMIQREVVADEFGVSICSFHFTGRPGLISLWIAGGQDGQQVYWLKRKGMGFTVNRVDELSNCIPPVFSTDRSTFLTLNEERSVCQYDFRRMKQTGSCLESGDDDNPLAESLCYLDAQHAIASTGEGRIFIINTEAMRIEDEVGVEGHEPKPIGEYYSSLSHETGLGTDISFFERLGEMIVFVFRRDGGTGLESWKDSLLWYSIPR